MRLIAVSGLHGMRALRQYSAARPSPQSSGRIDGRCPQDDVLLVVASKHIFNGCDGTEESMLLAAGASGEI